MALTTERGREIFCCKSSGKDEGVRDQIQAEQACFSSFEWQCRKIPATDKEEFYSTVDLNLETLTDEIAEWQFYYNWQRIHGSLNGKTPIE